MYLWKFLKKRENFTPVTSQILFEIILNNTRTSIPKIYKEIEARTGIDKDIVKSEIDMLLRLDYLFIENGKIKPKERLWSGLL